MRFTVLKTLFARFIRNRGMMHHFRRLANLEGLMRTGVNKELSPALVATLISAAHRDSALLLTDLNSHTDGLTNTQAELLLEQWGLNEVEHEKPLPWWDHLWHSYRNPFNLLLSLLASISYLTDDAQAAIVILIMVLLSTLLRFWQERKSNLAAEKLKEMVSNTATVIRRDLSEDAAPVFAKEYGIHLHIKPAQKYELPIKQLVPGDIVLLSAGDMIPADLRILSAKDLFISQTTMTGESLPVEKFAQLHQAHTNNPLELDNILFMGTNVISGSATALVLATGQQTYFGTLAQRIISTDRAPTAFQTSINQVSWLLIRFMIVMVPLVLLLNVLTKGSWLEAFLFALSIAVGLTPEMLPMIVTSTLAKGAVLLSRKQVIVKHLDAIQNFGAMDILCTDKTGTLTQDKIFLERHTNIFGETSEEVLKYAYLNSYYQTGLKNLLDIAVLESIDIKQKSALTSTFQKIDEIPFDFSRRRMSVVIATEQDKHILICKGAVEEILQICTNVRHGDMTEPITDETLTRIRAVTASLNQEGLRVVAVAIKEIPDAHHSEKIDNDVPYQYGVVDETELTLVGYIAFLDPPKETTAPALAALKKYGVTVKILTGDNELVTAKICQQVGLPVESVLLGNAIENMDDAQLAQAVERCHIFAKLTPLHKERIVHLLKVNGHIVGFMGDGINDAPALRAADIGISVDSGVDIAKEAADIILLEKSLMVLKEGVLEGRKTFVNMLKYIKITASSNFGNVFSVLIASAFLPFLPMMPIQLLVQNLLYDISQIAIPFDHVDPEQIKAPQRWQANDVGRLMLCFGPISSIFDVITFTVMWFVFQANTIEQQALFQSGWFIVGLVTQMLIVHTMRTAKIPFIQSRAAAALMVTTLTMMTIGIFLPMGPLSHNFKFQTLPLSYFPFLLITIFSYMTLVQLVKHFYIRRYGWQ